MSELLHASGLEKRFALSRGLIGKTTVDVLNGVSFSLAAGETLGLVGESGSGKTTLARCVTGMLVPDAGRVIYDGIDLHRANRHQQTMLRRQLSFVYQNPFRSLNPRFTLYQLIAEPLQVQRQSGRVAMQQRVDALLEQVGMGDVDPARRISSLSGGQAQRIAIARALALQPRLMILDEPTSALDVSVQAQILNLLVSLQRQAGFSCLFISHDLDVVRYLCDCVMVMEQGIIVETGETARVMQSPEHHYTRMLIDATPRLAVAQSLNQ